jgi:hypothetical protein
MQLMMSTSNFFWGTLVLISSSEDENILYKNNLC